MSENAWENVDEMSFKQASDQLEQVVRSLEGGELELEDALESYNRGVELLKSLRERLADAERRVKELEGTELMEAPDDKSASASGALGDKSRI